MCAHQVSVNKNDVELTVDDEDEPITDKISMTIIDVPNSDNHDDDVKCKLSVENYANPGTPDVLLLLDNDVLVDQFKEDKSKAKRRKTKRYYKRQLNLLESYKQDRNFSEKFSVDEEAACSQYDDETLANKSDKFLTSATLLVNVALFFAKIVAAALSGSLVIISSVIDSAMDLTTGAVIFFTSRAIRKRDISKYPRGRSRLEPLALIIISVVMGAANVQVIVKSVEDLATHSVDPQVGIPSLVIMICTVVVKFVLMIVCFLFPSPNARVLGQDHRNDCISNTAAVVFGFLATKYWVYLDPMAAIVVSMYIIGTWMKTGFQQVAILSGKTADPEVINRIVKMCMDHRPKVDLVDTVYAYHFGLKYLVEVDVVLNENMTVKESHDISEPLQRKLERLPFVERAFVHVDYETQHKPYYEHKLV